MKTVHAGFVAAIRERLKARKVSARAAASNAGLPERSVQGVLEGHVPSIDRAAQICRALDLELTLGPVRVASGESRGAAEPRTARGRRDAPGLGDVEKHLQALVRAVVAAGGNPFPPDLQDETLTGLVATHEAPPGARPVDVVELEAAAGGGGGIDGERVLGLAWFARSWLDRHGLDATQCAIIRVRGESMEPTLVDGCSILVNHASRRRRLGRIYVLRTDEGLVVKRAGRDPAGIWQLVSDNPDKYVWPTRPWPRDAEIVGEVKWAARTFA